MIQLNLVGGIPTPLKNMNSSVGICWDDYIPNIWKVIKFHGSKPPTRNGGACPSPGLVFRVSIKSWGVDQGEACCVPKSNLSLVHPWNKVPLFL